MCSSPPLQVDAVIPVDDVLVAVVEAHVVAQVLGALLGGLQKALLAGEHVGRGEAVDQARNRVGLLAVVAFLAARQVQNGAVVAIVDGLVGIVELPAQVAVGNGTDLLDPPIRLLVAVVTGAISRKDHRFDLDPQCSGLGIENAVGVNLLARLKHVLNARRAVLIGLFEVLGNAGVCGGREINLELTVVAGFEFEIASGAINLGDVAGNGV